MLNLNELLKKTTAAVEKKSTGPNSERVEIIGSLLELMEETKPTAEERTLEKQTPGAGKAEHRKRLNRRTKYWLGRTRHLTPSAIYGLIRKARDGNKPPALFNHLLKQTKQ
jgi:hypothetical protein